MKIIVCSLAFLCMGPLIAQQFSAKEAFLEKWENSKHYLIAAAEAMPEEDYDFKPTERQRSFKEQLLHISGNINWLSTSYFSKTEYIKPPVDTSLSKAEILVQLSEVFNKASFTVKSTPDDELSTTVDFFAGIKSKLQILNLLQDHVTHHRGQLVVYLNLKNIEPPQYVGW